MTNIATMIRLVSSRKGMSRHIFFGLQDAFGQLRVVYAARNVTSFDEVDLPLHLEETEQNRMETFKRNAVQS